MALPVVAIIGRPNVGKSSLLNALSGHMISIVEPTAGVTRDRVSTIIGRDDPSGEFVIKRIVNVNLVKDGVDWRISNMVQREYIPPTVETPGPDLPEALR